MVSNSVTDRVTYSAYFRDLSCVDGPSDFQVGLICQRGGLEEGMTTISTTRKPDCPSGWHQFNDDQGLRKCFHLSTDQRYHSDAETQCVSYGGHLASILSRAEQDFIFSAFNSEHSKEVWVGGVNFDQDDVWEWTDGSTFSFTNWASGEPDRSKYMYLQPTTWNWRDYGEDSCHYMCQLSY